MIESIVFKNGNSLAIRLLGDCRLPKGTKIREYRDGNKIIIEPLSKTWPNSFVETLGGWDGEIERPIAKMTDPFA